MSAVWATVSSAWTQKTIPWFTNLLRELPGQSESPGFVIRGLGGKPVSWLLLTFKDSENQNQQYLWRKRKPTFSLKIGTLPESSLGLSLSSCFSFLYSSLLTLHNLSKIWKGQPSWPESCEHIHSVAFLLLSPGIISTFRSISTYF